MKIKKYRKYQQPLSDSNMTEHENLRSHYDPNGSYTGTPDGWRDDVPTPVRPDVPDKWDVEGGEDNWDFSDVPQGTPTTTDGYPSIPDGELPVWRARVKEDITPVQDADDL